MALHSMRARKNRVSSTHFFAQNPFDTRQVRASVLPEVV